MDTNALRRCAAAFVLVLGVTAAPAVFGNIISAFTSGGTGIAYSGLGEIGGARQVRFGVDGSAPVGTHNAVDGHFVFDLAGAELADAVSELTDGVVGDVFEFYFVLGGFDFGGFGFGESMFSVPDLPPGSIGGIRVAFDNLCFDGSRTRNPCGFPLSSQEGFAFGHIAILVSDTPFPVSEPGVLALGAAALAATAGVRRRPRKMSASSSGEGRPGRAQRLFIRDVLDLEPVARDVPIPRQGPLRPASAGAGRAREQAGREGGGAARAGGEGGGGAAAGLGMGGAHAHGSDDDADASRG